MRPLRLLAGGDVDELLLLAGLTAVDGADGADEVDIVDYFLVGCSG